MATTSTTSSGLSTTEIAGLAAAGAAALVLAIILTVVFIRRRRNGALDDEEKAPRMIHVQPRIIGEPLPADLQAIREPSAGLGRSVSRRNLTPSIILPAPVPPVPAARPRPPKVSPRPALHASGRPMSSLEIVEHHQAAGSMPRPFAPFSFALNPMHDVPGADPRTSTATATFSRSSILSASLRSSSLRNSLSSFRSSFSSAAPAGGPELLKIRHVFTPLLPDELVLRLNEKVSLIQTFDDGWCVVGRKSAFHAPSPAKANGYAFGQGKTVDEVEIGAVPAWVFEKHANGSAKPERPMRSSSLGITLTLDEGKGGVGGVREDVISWSNF